MPTTSFPRDPVDPSGRFVLELAARLSERGHRIEVLAPEPAERIHEPALPSGVTLRWLPYVRPRSLSRTFYGAGVLENLVRSPLAWPGVLTHPLALAAALARGASRWDAVVSHWVVPCGVLAASVLPAALPHVAIAHSGDAHLLARLPFRASIARRLASRARIVASSAATRSVLDASLGDGTAIDVLPMGTDEPPLSPGEREAARAALGVDRFVVLSIARLVPVKRIDVAIDATAGLEGATLVLAGDGPLRPSLEARARTLGIDARFLGAIAPSERRRWLAAADVVVLSSAPRASGRTEGAPLAIAEAIAAGVPVIASATGGVVDRFRDGEGGLLVSPGDVAALAAALRRVMREPGLRARLSAGALGICAPTMRETAERIEDALLSARVPSAR